MRKLVLLIDAGEKTCASTPGAWCRFMGATRMGTAPVCLLFRDAAGDPHPLYDADGRQEGWLQRLPECRDVEAQGEAP